MDEVSFNSHGTGFVIVNSQAVLLQKDSEVNSINEINEEIFQSALNDVNASNSSKDIECLQDALPANSDIGNLAENGFVIVSDEQKLNSSKMIQLSLEQASELGLSFSLDSENVKEVPKQMESCQNILGQQYFYQEPLEQGTGMCEINCNNGTDIQNTLDLSTYNDLLQLPTVNVNDNLSQQITLVPQYINGQLTYTLQIGDGLNNTFELAQVPNVGNSTSLTVPTVTVSTQQSLDKLPSSVVKCTPVTASSLHSEGTSLDKVISANLVVCNGTSESSNNVAVSTLAKDQVSTLVIPSKVLMMNTKPRILTSAKTCNRNILSNMTKVDVSKSINSKIQVSASKGQSLLISNQKKIAPLRMPLPPLNSNSSKHKEIIVATNQRPIVYKSLPPSKSIVASKINNNVIKRQLVSVSTKPSYKLNESSLSVKVPSALGVDQLSLPNSNQVQSQKVLKTAESLSVQKTDSSCVNGAKPARRLTQSQLKQIATVLQKNRNNQSGFSSPSTLYDTETNTRIICRVVYPEDLVGRVENRVSLAKKRGRPSKCKVNETVCEKKPLNEERKKQALSRTRSGRLSRPPRHMIKDYKRLQGDDSDDAYSDYVSETEDNSENSAAVNLLPGLSLRQKRNISSEFRCPTCNKIYLGHQRMRWHFTKYPDHGSEKHLQSLTINIPEIDGNSSINGGNNSKNSGLCRRGIGWGRGRGKVKRLHPDLSLKEIMKNYKEAEIVEGASETVARTLSGWELLLLRLDAIRNGKSRVSTLCDELSNIVQKIRQTAENVFRPEIEGENSGETYKLEDDVLAHIIGIPKGSYIINDSALESVVLGLKKEEETIVNDLSDELPSSDSKRCKIEEDAVAPPAATPPDDPGENRCESSSSSFLLNSEILCDKSFNSSDKSGIEDSVDQIVSERLKTLAPVDDIMSSLTVLPDTNRSLVSSVDLMAGLLTSVVSMSTQSLTDSIFTSPNESRLTNQTHVSASTEDLMKSLENLSREINGDDSHGSTLPTTDLDFTVLSQDFTTGR